MKLHNTLGNKTIEFEPIKSSQVGLYSCGPTLYNHAHIGNLASFITADILRRALSLSGYRVTHVMNFTDIDDKTIARSQTGEFAGDDPMASLKNLTDYYERMFLADIEAVGIAVDEIVFVRATNYIEQMQQLIRRLYDKGLAYIGDDGVYFSLSAYREHYSYGVLSNVPALETTKSRINNDEYDKDSANDFALWKKRSGDEPMWKFDLDGEHLDGRPGWHLECSVMSAELLGQPFDIHTGGVDLIFPHHENEIAQSKGANGKDLANVFVHSEHLLVEDKKMAKSAGNFLTLEEITKRKFDPLALRLLVLQGHYSHQLNFTWDSLKSAQTFLQQLRNFADLRFQPTDKPSLLTDQDFTDTTAAMQACLEKNLDTPGALAALAQIVSKTSGTGKVPDSLISTLEAFIEWADSAFGLQLLHRKDITAEQKEVITNREKARLEEDFEMADRLRDQLDKDDLVVKDSSSGPVWQRKLT